MNLKTKYTTASISNTVKALGLLLKHFLLKTLNNTKMHLLVFHEHCCCGNIKNPQDTGFKATGKSLLCWMISNDRWTVLRCCEIIQLLTHTSQAFYIYKHAHRFNRHFQVKLRLAGFPLDSQVSIDLYPKHSHGTSQNTACLTQSHQVLFVHHSYQVPSISIDIQRFTQCASYLCSTCPKRHNLPS